MGMLSDKKLVLFTFDYELFLGKKSGSVESCLIIPTKQLLSVLHTYKFKAVFFIDTVYLLRLKEIAQQYPRAANDLALISEQLKTIVEDGHYIFPHLHPHWLDADYLPDVNEWSLTNLRYYQFSSLPKEKQDYLFENSIATIQSVVQNIKTDYKIDSYRAGGWSIQPFEYFKPQFLKNGIYNEWSVIPGNYLISDAHTFDFRNAPVDLPVYHYNDDVCLESKDGIFKEWTISCIAFSSIGKWFNFKINGVLKRLGKLEKQKGSTVSSMIKEEGDIYSNKNKKRMIASFEGLNYFTLRKYFSAIERKNYFQFISHPKLITPYEFNIIKKLLKKLKSYGNIETDFRNYYF